MVRTVTDAEAHAPKLLSALNKIAPDKQPQTSFSIYDTVAEPVFKLLVNIDILTTIWLRHGYDKTHWRRNRRGNENHSVL